MERKHGQMVWVEILGKVCVGVFVGLSDIIIILDLILLVCVCRCNQTVVCVVWLRV